MQLKNENISDELDLGDLLFGIWNVKWLILLNLVVSIFLSIIIIYFYNYYYNNTEKQIFNGTLELQQISKVDIVKNYSTFQSKYTDIQITPRYFLSLLINDLMKRQTIIDAFKNFNVLKRKNYSNDEDYETALFDRSYNFKFKKKTSEIFDQNYWTITFNTENVKQTKLILHTAFKNSNENVRNILAQNYEMYLKAIQLRKKNSLEDIDIKISNSIEDYDNKIQKVLAHLQEQSELARYSGITNFIDLLIEQQNYIPANELSFWHGYELIEKKMSIIQNRKHKDLFVDEITNLEQKKRAINQNKDLERLRDAFLMTPISKGNFHSGTYHISIAEDKSEKNSSPYIFLSSFFFIFGSLLIFLQRIIKIKIQNKK